jgi:DNA transformation protein
MFGGAGIFRDRLMFGLIADEQLYLKTDDHNRSDFEAEDCPPFTYEAKGEKRALMSYSLLPERLYDDPEELADWARKAFDAALRGDAAKPKSKRKSP